MNIQYLFVIDSAPYGSWKGREILDMAFAAAAFDQSVALFFSHSGVNWLRKDQSGQAIDQKTVARQLAAAELFGLEGLYADRGSLERYGISEQELGLPTTSLGSMQDLLGADTRVVRL